MSNLRRQNLLSSSNILARNMKLRDDGDNYCSGTYLDKDNEIKTCDINLPKPKFSFGEAFFKEYMNDTQPDPTKQPPQNFEEYVLDELENAGTDIKGVVQGLETEITSDYDHLKEYLDKGGDELTIEDYNPGCQELLRLDQNKSEFLRLCHTGYCTSNNRNTRDILSCNTYDEDNCVSNSCRWVPGNLDNRECITRLGNSNFEDETFQSRSRCLKVKKDDNWVTDTIPNIDDFDNGDDNNSSPQSKDECLIKNPDGAWCSYCSGTSHPLQNIVEHTQNRPEFSTFLQQSHDEWAWDITPGEGCFYKDGGVLQDFIDGLNPTGILSCLFDPHNFTLTNESFHDDWDKAKKKCYGENGDNLKDLLVVGAQESQQTDRSLEQQFVDITTCSDSASDGYMLLGFLADMTSVVDGPLGLAIGEGANVVSNSVGECSSEKKELFNLHGTCPNGYRDCPKYIYCDPAEVNCCDPTTGSCPNETAASMYDPLDCTNCPVGNNDISNYTSSSPSDCCVERIPITIEECDSTKPTYQYCQSCTAVRNMKGLEPGDRERVGEAGNIFAGLDPYSIPGVSEGSNNDKLDTFNDYFCIDDNSTRVYRPPPLSLPISMDKNIEFINENGGDINNKAYDLSNVISGYTGGLEKWVNDIDLLEPKDKNNLSNDLCKTKDAVGSVIDGYLEAGDGQGFDIDTCGKRKVNYSDSNPCKEGYTLAGPKHLNPMGKYDKDPCIYYNEEECTQNVEKIPILNKYDSDGVATFETRNHICEWIPSSSSPNLGDCRLKEKLFETNYCCRSIPGAEKCPYTPIESWTKFNFATNRNGELMFDNNRSTLNLNMIQDGNSCGDLISSIHCNYDNNTPKPSIRESIDRKIQFESANNTYHIQDYEISSDLDEEQFSNKIISPTHSNLLNETDYGTTFMNNDYFQTEGDIDIWNQGEDNYSTDDLDFKHCKQISTGYTNRTFEDEINDYATSRIYCPSHNPGMSGKKPYLISALPCLNPKNWAVLKKLENDKKPYLTSKQLIYSYDKADEDDIKKYNDYLKLLLDTKSTYYNLDPDNPIISFEEALEKEGYPNSSSSPGSICFELIPESSPTRHKPTYKQGCYYLGNGLTNDIPKSYQSGIYTTWDDIDISNADSKSLLSYFKDTIDNLFETDQSYGVCDIETVKSLLNDKNKKYLNSNENPTGGNICCNSPNGCISANIKQRCIDKDDNFIFKTYINPSPPDKFLDDIKSENDGKIIVEKYDYQINNKKNCIYQNPQGYWNENFEKCFEIYRSENIDGTLREEKNIDNCEDDGYGIWVGDDGPNSPFAGSKQGFTESNCLKINVNKSDCLLSGGNWEPTIKVDTTPDKRDDSDDLNLYDKITSIYKKDYAPVKYFTHNDLKEIIEGGKSEKDNCDLVSDNVKVSDSIVYGGISGLIISIPLVFLSIYICKKFIIDKVKIPEKYYKLYEEGEKPYKIITIFVIYNVVMALIGIDIGLYAINSVYGLGKHIYDYLSTEDDSDDDDDNDETSGTVDTDKNEFVSKFVQYITYFILLIFICSPILLLILFIYFKHNDEWKDKLLGSKRRIFSRSRQG